MKSKANCIIIHGCPDSLEPRNPEKPDNESHWLPWIKDKLNKIGIKTETPNMPEPWKPDYEAFRIEFEKYEVNEHTILIGHSCGCAFLVRWLGDNKREIGVNEK